MIAVLLGGEIFVDRLPELLTGPDIEQRQGHAVFPAAPLDLLADLPQRIGDVARHVDIGLVVAVHLGGPEIDMDDLLGRTGVPERRRIFDQIVADRDDRIRFAQRRDDVILALQADREQAVLVRTRDRPLAHEGVDDADAREIGEPLELDRSAFADRAVAGNDQRPPGAHDDVDRLGDRLVVGAGPARDDRRDRRAVRL